MGRKRADHGEFLQPKSDGHYAGENIRPQGPQEKFQSTRTGRLSTREQPEPSWGLAFPGIVRGRTPFAVGSMRVEKRVSTFMPLSTAPQLLKIRKPGGETEVQARPTSCLS